MILGGSLLGYGIQRDRLLKQERLRKIFYDLIHTGYGEITTLQFAMASGLTGSEAKAFLDELAQEFNASYNVLEEGSISYRFQTLGTKD